MPSVECPRSRFEGRGSRLERRASPLRIRGWASIGGSHHRQPAPAARRRGFTLIEAALTTVIVGVGMLSIMAAQQAYHMKNMWAQRTATGLLLANEVRELTFSLPMHDPFMGDANLGPEVGELTVTNYDDLDDFAGVVNAGIGAGLQFDPPINALRQPIADMDGWSQQVMVENVLPGNISSTFTQPLGATDLMRVTVNVRYQGPNDVVPMTITQLVWVVGRDA